MASPTPSSGDPLSQLGYAPIEVLPTAESPSLPYWARADEKAPNYWYNKFHEEVAAVHAPPPPPLFPSPHHKSLTTHTEANDETAFQHEMQKMQLLAHPVKSKDASELAADILAIRAQETKALYSPTSQRWSKPPWIAAGFRAPVPAPPAGEQTLNRGALLRRYAPGNSFGSPPGRSPRIPAGTQLPSIKYMGSSAKLEGEAGQEGYSAASSQMEGVASDGVTAAHIMKTVSEAEEGWASIEEELTAIRPNSPSAPERLVQVRSTLLQRSGALEIQLQKMDRACSSESVRADRLATKLRKTARTSRKIRERLLQEFSVLYQRQRELEAHVQKLARGSPESSADMLSDIGSRAVEVRKQNEELQAQLEALQKSMDPKREEEKQQLYLWTELQREEAEGQELEKQLRSLQREEVLRLQRRYKVPRLAGLNVKVEISLDGQEAEASSPECAQTFAQSRVDPVEHAKHSPESE